MVKLPTLQPRGVLTRGPQSSVSPSEVANPFQQIANAFNATGEVALAKELDDARIIGQAATFRDDQGNLQVELKPNWSEKGRTYNRYASQAFAAQSEIDTKAAMAKFQQEARGNVDTFRASAKAYRDEFLSRTPRDLRGPVATMLDAETQLGSTGVMDQKYRADMNMAKATILSSIAMKQDEMAALARQGGTSTDAYRARQSEVRTLFAELTADPIFQISPEEAENKMNATASRDMAEAMLGEANRAIEAGGPEAARQLAERLMNDETLSLSPTERRQYAGMIHETVRNYRAEQKAAVEPLKDVGKERVKQWEAGIGLDVSDDNDLIANIRKGDPAFARYLEMRRSTLRQVQAIKSMSNDDQLRLLESSGSVVDRIVGVESGGRADAKNPNSSATGLGQFIDSTWLNMMRQHRPDLVQGRSAQEVLALRNNPEISREMTARYAQENANFLRNQGLAPTDGNVYLAHFLGPRGAAQVLKADPSASVASIVGQEVVNANKFLAGKTAADLSAWADKKMGGAATLTAEAGKALSEEVTSDLRSDLPRYRSMLARGDVPDEQSLDLLTRQLALVADQDLRTEYAQLFTQSEGFRSGYQDAPATAEAFLSRLQAASAVGGISLAESEVMDAYRRGSEAAARERNADPIGFGAKRGIIPQVELDLSQPDTWADTFQSLQKGVDVLRARGEVGNISALRPAVQAQVERALASSTPQGSLLLLRSMAQNLSPGTFQATLNKIAASGEGNMTAHAGALVRDNPDVAVGILRGRDQLRQNPNLAPKKTDDNRRSIDEMLPSSAFAPALEGSRQSLLEAATARYADLSQQAGDSSGELNDDRMQQAITEVTGGLVDMNGAEIIAPRYGMTQDDFDKTLGSLTDQDMAGAVTSSGQPVRISDLRNEGRLRAVADGRYILEFGSADYPTYVMRSAPHPGGGADMNSVFVLDLRDR